MKKFLDLISYPVYQSLSLLFITIMSRFVSIKVLAVIMFFIFASLLCSSILFFKFKRHKSAVICVLLIFASSIFLIRVIDFTNKYTQALSDINISEEIVGYIDEYPVYKEKKIEFKFKVLGIKNQYITDFKKVQPFNIIVKVSKKDESNIKFMKGEKLHIKKKISLPNEMVSTFKYRDYLFTNKVFGEIKAINTDIIKLDNRISVFHVDNNIFCKVLYNWREELINKFKNVLSADSFGFLVSIFLGIRSDLDDDIYQDFQDSGMVHLIAISGMHISFIGGFIFKILNMLISKSKAYIISLLVLFAYIMLLSYQPSSQRAFIMYAMIVFFFITGNKSGSLTSISVATVILLFINPYCIYNLGFQFSFLATLGIILFNRDINNFLPKFLPSKIKDTTSVTLSAFTAIFVIQWGLFGKVAILPLISSIIIIPMFELLFTELFFCSIVFYITGFSFVANIMDVSTKLFLFCIKVISYVPPVRFPDIPIFIGYLSIPIMFILLFGIIPFIKRKVTTILCRDKEPQTSST